LPSNTRKGTSNHRKLSIAIHGRKKEIAQITKSEPSQLEDLYKRFENAKQKFWQIDMRCLSTKELYEYDKIMDERYKVYAEYSALKAEAKKMKKNLP